MTKAHLSIVVAGCVVLALATTSVVSTQIVGWTWREWVESYALTNLVVGLALAVCGVMIGWFRPRNLVGVLSLIAGMGHLVSAVSIPLCVLGITEGWPEPVTRLLAALFLAGWTLGLPGLFPIALLLFPSGRLPSPSWRPVAILLGGSALFGLLSALVTSEQLVPGEPGSVSLFAVPNAPIAVFEIVLVVVGFVSVLLVLASLILRYVTGDEQTRRQLLWLILALLAMFGLNLQRWATGDGPILLLLSIVFLPAAIAIAIVRYRLLDIRVVLSRTLLYGLLITVVIALYAGLVAAVTLVVPTEADRAVAIFAAVLVALAFNPLRILLQRAIARTFYGTRDDPGDTAHSVTSSINTAADLGGVLSALRASLRLPRVSVRAPEDRILASDGIVASSDDDSHDAPTVMLPLSSAGKDWGLMEVTLRPGERSLHAGDRRALEMVAPLIGMVLRERALVDDLRDARAQTVEARESERHALHRDLHDGLGPTLTSAALRLDAAGNLVDTDPAKARTALAHARSDVSDALREVRRVVYGLRPIPLDEHGLVGALREQAEHPAALTVEVHASDSLPPLSPAVELAAYRVAVEGIANANRHSTGSMVTVDVALAPDAEELLVTVRDNGIPPSDFRAGVGLRSLIDRVEELGGSVDVGPAGSGWTVDARLPLRA